jgi:predicted site-specific integrase-resolvase
MTKKYVRASYIKQRFDISTSTLNRWAKSGKLKFLVLPECSKRLYDYEHFLSIFDIKGADTEDHKRDNVIYARVSSSHQKEDLVRQVELLKKHYPNSKVVQEVGSGLNWKRKSFQHLLERVIEGDVEEIVVSTKDRLCRFGFELIEWLCKKFNCKIVVLNEVTDPSPEIELSQDVLAIIQYFTAKNNGMRAAKLRREREKNKDEKNKRKENTVSQNE